MTKAERDRDYLDHIRQAIDRIDEYLTGITRERFLSDRLLQDAVIRNIEIVRRSGEKTERRLHGTAPRGAVARHRRDA
jgi:uncharacterized protein with HEPN domain